MGKLGKIGIVVDSASGLTEAQAKQKGWYYLPLVLTINGDDYKDGVDINANKYYEIIKLADDVRTASTSPIIVEEVIDKAAKENDYVIVYTISKHLSKQNENIQLFKGNHKNVFVIDSLSATQLITLDCELIQKKAKDFDQIKDLVNFANEITQDTFGIIMPLTMSWLKKGGRVTGATAALASMLNIVPMIGFKDGKLEKIDKGRSFEKTIIKAATNYLIDDNKEWQYTFLNANNENGDEIFKKVKEVTGIKNWNKSVVPPIIANHIGPGAIGILRSRKN